MNHYLYNQSGTSDKVYFLDISANGANFDVVASWGAKGKNLKTEVKGSNLSKSDAMALAEKLAAQKIKSGYIKANSLEAIPEKTVIKSDLPKNFKVKNSDEVMHVIFAHNTAIPTDSALATAPFGIAFGENAKFDAADALCYYNTDGEIYLLNCSEADVQAIVKKAGEYVKEQIDDDTSYLEEYYLSDSLLFWPVPGYVNKYILISSNGAGEIFTGWIEENLPKEMIELNFGDAHMAVPTNWSEESKEHFYDEFGLDAQNAQHNQFWDMLESCSRENFAKLSAIFKNKEELEGAIEKTNAAGTSLKI